MNKKLKLSLLIGIPIGVILFVIALSYILLTYIPNMISKTDVILIGEYDIKNQDIYDNRVITKKEYEELFPNNDSLKDVDFSTKKVVVIEFNYDTCEEKDIKVYAKVTKIKDSPVINTTIEYTKECSKCSSKFSYYAVVVDKEFNDSNYTVKMNTKARNSNNCNE